MEILTGYVKNIVFRNTENGYTVLVLVADGEELTCVGSLGAADLGDYMECEGDYTEHPVYGAQFQAVAYRLLMPDDAVRMERYLASGAVKGIGEALAARIVAAFGDDTFRIMEEEPERLAEVKGISLKKALEIALAMQEKSSTRAALVFLQGYGIGGALAARIVRRYGDEVYQILKSNPYRLADDIEGVGFKTADEIALKSGISASGAYRIRGGILYALRRAESAGHCYLPGDVLAGEVRRLLEIECDDASLETEMLTLQMEGRMMCVLPKESEGTVPLCGASARVYAASLYHAEYACARMLLSLREDAYVDMSQAADDTEALTEEILTVGLREGITPDEMQEKAAMESVRSGVVIITGGPGTGKTTTINTILRLYEARGLEVLLGAPTGRAARRMSEATGYEAKTIHRLLEVRGVPDEEGAAPVRFERNETNPLEADAVIIDEMSMVDIRLFLSLLKALSPGTRLLLVGDANQLPSVGAGQVLRDLIDSGAFPTIVLNKIFRQEEASDIILNAHRIQRGTQIALDNSAKDFFFLKRDDAAVISKHIVTLVRDKLPPYLHVDATQIQVLTPMKKGALGAVALNRLLQRELNPPRRGVKEHTSGERLFREGDKVMQIKNNYQAVWEVLGHRGIVTERGEGIFNGDLGVITEINEYTATLTVLFDEGRRVTYGFADLSELELAYAQTIHKSQGSEYPAVVMPLLGGPRLLMNRNLLYTGVTRARELVVILGSVQTVEEMIASEDETKRYTGLCTLLTECAIDD